MSKSLSLPFCTSKSQVGTNLYFRKNIKIPSIAESFISYKKNDFCILHFQRRTYDLHFHFLSHDLSKADRYFVFSAAHDGSDEERETEELLEEEKRVKKRRLTHFEGGQAM